MTNLNDDDIDTGPTEDDENVDTGGESGADTGDEPTEADENLDAGDGERDTGDEA